MKILNLLNRFDHVPFFTTEGFRQMWEDRRPKARYALTALYRWMRAGKIIQLKKGVYMTRRFYERHAGNENFLPAMSAVILPQSYVSLEYVLQRHSILTEVTYPVTAVTPKNTRIIENNLGIFTFQHIKSGLYKGYTVRDYLGIPFATASPAKALFDFLYLRPSGDTLSDPEYDLADDLRLNLDEFSSGDREEFAAYVEESRQMKMAQIYTNLRRTAWLH